MMMLFLRVENGHTMFFENQNKFKNTLFSFYVLTDLKWCIKNTVHLPSLKLFIKRNLVDTECSPCNVFRRSLSMFHNLFDERILHFRRCT